MSLKSKVLGAISNSILQNVIEYYEMTRKAGHTYAAVNGVKNSERAKLLTASKNSRVGNMDPEKKISISTFLHDWRYDRCEPLVIDNSALVYIFTELMHKVEKALDHAEEHLPKDALSEDKDVLTTQDLEYLMVREDWEERINVLEERLENLRKKLKDV